MFRLLRYFSFTSAIALIIFTVALAYLYRQNAVDELTDMAENSNAALARSFANTIWPQFHDYVAGASGLDGAALRARPESQQIHKELMRLMRGLPVLKIKIYNRSGLTVYSSEPSQMGADKSDSPGLQSAARDGVASTKLTFRDRFNSFEGVVSDRNLVESYLPIRQGNGRVDGVFELYSDVTPLYDRIQRTTTKIVVGLLLAFGALYVTLFFIVRRAGRILERQYVDLEREVAERRNAEARLKSAQEEMEQLVGERTGELRAVLDNAIDAIVSIDGDGTVIWFNAAAEKTFGYDASEVVGRDVSLLMPHSMRAFHERAVGNCKASDGRSRIIGATNEQEGMRKDGTRFPIELSVGRAMAGPKPVFVGIMRDITERKQVQENLLHSQKMDAIGQLTGGVAHEFNNLLTAIGGFARMAQRNIEDVERTAQCIGEIVKASDQAASLTSQMLAFGRKQEIKPKLVRVGGIIGDLRAMLSPLISESIALSIAVEDDDACTVIDPNQLTTAILNLALNGSHAMPEGGELVIGSRVARPDARLMAKHPAMKRGSYITAYVMDTGTGIDDETRKRIFEPFFTTREIGEGSGLGLSMVYGTVEQAGGFIDVVTKVGEGTTFTLFLPLADAAEVGGSAPSAETVRRKGGGTVLVAEDKEAVRELARITLEEFGYSVLTAVDGVKAAELYRDHGEKIDLLLTDVAMPGKSGPDLARELLKHSPDLKVIFMSGHSFVGSADREEMGEGSVFLQKPFDPDHLIELVQELMAA